MTLEELRQEIEQAYPLLSETEAAYYTAKSEYEFAKENLDNAQAIALASGQVVGKNADERKGNLVQHFAGDVRRVQELQLMVDACRADWVMASNHVKMLDKLLRIEELLGGKYDHES